MMAQMAGVLLHVGLVVSGMRMPERLCVEQKAGGMTTSRRGFVGAVAGTTAGVVSSGGIVEKTVAAEASVFEVGPKQLAGTVVVVTGANAGLGLESACRLAAGGATVVATGRTEAKAEKAVSAVRERVPGAAVRGVTLDLGSLASVKSFPERVGVDAVDVLVNNAGVMAIPEERSTDDGFERQIGVNFLGHFALTAALLPLLKKRSTFRVVNVSSSANMGATRAQLDGALASNRLAPDAYSQWGNYCTSKAMNILFSTELQRRFDAAGLRASAVSLHPGAVATDLGRYLLGGADAVSTADAVADAGPLTLPLLKLLSNFVLPVPEGANTQVFLAAAADAPPTADGRPDFSAHGGLYYDKMRPATPNALTQDPVLARSLFDAAERLTNTHILDDVAGSR